MSEIKKIDKEEMPEEQESDILMADGRWMMHVTGTCYKDCLKCLNFENFGKNIQINFENFGKNIQINFENFGKNIQINFEETKKNIIFAQKISYGY